VVLICISFISQTIFDKGIKDIQWGKEVFLINDAEETGYSYAEE
jgi:hypothetical protein